MNLRRTWTIFIRQFSLLKERQLRLFFLFYWPTVDLFLWGVLTLYLRNVGGSSLNFITALIGAIIFWNFMTRVQHGVTVSFLEDSWVRNFMNLFASPLTVSEYVGGLVLISTFQTSISVVFISILAWLLFAYNVFQFGMLLIPFIGVLFLFGLALGIFTTALILRFGPSAEFLAWSIPAILSPLAGVFYPVSALPKIIQPFSNILPPSHVFEGMRSVVTSGTFDTSRLLLALGLSVVCFIVAYWFLLHVYKIVLERGLFTRFMTD